MEGAGSALRSTLPYLSFAKAKRARRLNQFVTSVLRYDRFSCSVGQGFRSPTTIFTPVSRRTLVVARPIPEDPPVERTYRQYSEVDLGGRGEECCCTCYNCDLVFQGSIILRLDGEFLWWHNGL